MSNETTQHTPADVRERVAKIVREAMEDARRSERLNTFPQSSMWDYTDRILALLRTPRGEGEADAESGGDVTVSQLLAVLDEYNAGVLCMTPENADGTPMFSVAVARGESAERLKQWASEDAEEPAALRSEAPASGWSEVRERANMLRAVLREHGFEHLRSALVGQHSDAVRYGQWERHKALLRDLLDALDAALCSEAQGEEEDPLVKEAVTLIDEAVSEIVG